MYPQDTYGAVWVSHSSMGDFLKCPRAYYLKNMYKDPKTRHKVSLVSPAMSLGTAVHEVVEGLALIKSDERFAGTQEEICARFLKRFDEEWAKVSGKRGGFATPEEEAAMKERGIAMIRRVAEHPGLLKEKTIRLKEPSNGLPPYFFISKEEGIILCGKIDWLVHVPKDDSIQILDFKTGKNDEKEDSLQLPIYALLLDFVQKRPVTGVWYWYLDRSDEPEPGSLPRLDDARERVLEVARAVKAAREQAAVDGPENVFICPRKRNIHKRDMQKGDTQKGAQMDMKGGLDDEVSKGCFACESLEKVLRGEAEFVGVGEYNQDLYFLS